MLSDSNPLVHDTTEDSYVFQVIFVTLITNIPNSFLAYGFIFKVTPSSAICSD